MDLGTPVYIFYFFSCGRTGSRLKTEAIGKIMFFFLVLISLLSCIVHSSCTALQTNLNKPYFPVLYSVYNPPYIEYLEFLLVLIFVQWTPRTLIQRVTYFASYLLHRTYYISLWITQSSQDASTYHLLDIPTWVIHSGTNLRP